MNLEVVDTFVPQVFSSTGAGQAVDVTEGGTNRINARLSCGAAVALTSLAVKMQAATDDGNGSPTGWVDIDGATFTTVTAGAGTPEMISFQLPEAASATAAPYQYVRAYGTLVGTSLAIACSLLLCKKFDGGVGSLNTPPTIN